MLWGEHDEQDSPSFKDLTVVQLQIVQVQWPVGLQLRFLLSVVPSCWVAGIHPDTGLELLAEWAGSPPTV